MNFFAKFLLIFGLVVGAAWYYNEPAGEYDRNIIYQSPMDEVQVESVRNHPVNPDVEISLSNSNGEVKIEGHEHDTIVIEVTKKGDKKHFADVHAVISVTPDQVSINTKYDHRYDHQNVSVQYAIWAPKDSILKSIDTINSAIYLKNLAGPIKTNSANGSIVIKNSENTVNAQSINGTVSLSVAALLQNQTVDLVSTNGAINCSLPETISADIKARTDTGSITSTFSLPTLTKQYVGQNAEGSIGAGQGGSIRLKTTNGAIRINAHS